MQLYYANPHKLDAALAQPLQFTKVSALQIEKRLDVVPLKVAERCLREMQEDGQIRLVRKSFRLPKGA